MPLMVPPHKYSTYIAIISSTFAISSVLGPLFGGAIADGSTWRWVFYLKYVVPPPQGQEFYDTAPYLDGD